MVKDDNSKKVPMELGKTDRTTEESAESAAGKHIAEIAAPIRISEHPEQFGKLSLLFWTFAGFRPSRYLRYIPWIVLLVITILGLPIAFRFYVESKGEPTGRVWLDSAKIIFIYVTITFSVALIAAGIYYKRLKRDLEEFEELAFLGRDFARFNLPYYRQEIKQLNEKLAGTNKEEVLTGIDMFKDLMPVINLLMAKEKNLLKWGLSGLKALKTVKSIFGGK
ncbi:MAG: hypothetical protein AB7W16_17950 [Candidatus Obscuribacterales bacterium]